MRKFASNQFKAVSKKKDTTAVQIFFLGIGGQCLKNYSCTNEVGLQHALQLVASKLHCCVTRPFRLNTECQV